MKKGSSPLTRGKSLGGLTGLSTVGLIPAHAGKISAVSTSCLLGGAHPRSRGENDRAVTEVAAELGSSPLTRGKLGRLDRSESEGRLIPAHAGKMTCAADSC